MNFPTFEETPLSPTLGNPGVAVVLSGAPFDRCAAVALHGTYIADAVMLQASNDRPLTAVMLIAIRRDRPDVVARSVEEPAYVIVPHDPGDPNSTFREIGHFNLDLRQHLELPDEPGRYWLLVSMGDHLTERLAFELT